MNSTKLALAFACDSRYLKYLNILIESIKRNSDKSYDLHLFSFEDLNVFDYENLHEINVHKLDRRTFTGFPLNVHLTLETYIRFVIPGKLSAYTHVIYFDVDMLVVSNLNGLFSTIGNVERVSMVNSFDKQLSEHHKLKNYYNAGLIVINVDWWYRKGVEKKLLESMSDINILGTLRYSDQCMLNLVLSEDIEDLNCIYNAHSNLSFDGIVVRHYSGNIKPWFIEYFGPDKMLYREYMKYFQVKTSFNVKSIFRIIKRLF